VGQGERDKVYANPGHLGCNEAQDPMLKSLVLLEGFSEYFSLLRSHGFTIFNSAQDFQVISLKRTY